MEYQLDGAEWQEAELGRVPNVDTWVQWAATVDVEPGEHRVVVRATDKSGYTQTSVETDVVPNGATGWDSSRSTQADTAADPRRPTSLRTGPTGRPSTRPFGHVTVAVRRGKCWAGS